MGEVFRAQDRLTGEIVALKQVRIPQRTGRPPPLGLVAKAPASLAQAATLAAAAGCPELAQAPEPSRLAMAAFEPVAAPAAAAALGSDEQPGGLGPISSAEHQALCLHLTQEFRTLAGLRHPHIVSVLDYGFDRSQQPFFTMELLNGGTPLQTAAHDQPFPVRLELLLQILQALVYLHRRGILHRDLKPTNILVLPGVRSPQVKLLDFGLAMLTRDLRIQPAEIAGTLGYMAPELLLGGSPSVASDLFAVGVIAHELLLGCHPFGERPTAALLQGFLCPVPIFFEDARLGDALSAVLRRALCRAPAERYIDASVFAHELASAAGLPVPQETTEIRESFLQAATFVAREQELATLRQALAAAQSANGSVWLVGGESGVGKSRLLDELRTLALVSGMRVVRGQAVSAGCAAYQVWQAPLRSLCLDADIEELEAGVLRSVVPDIVTLLGRPAPDPPALDPQSAQARFLLAAEKLLQSQPEPLLILLEDLHWAEPASLSLLVRLLNFVSHQPLLVVGTYRDDERPELPGDLPGANFLRLPRLSAAEMAFLSTSMLGEVGRRQEVVTLLERETEGNAFFIVEVLRVLAEELGTLGKIGSGRIPSRVTAGGVQAVLLRRLRRVPAEARPLLFAAAVFGRELDLIVLRGLQDAQSGPIEAHLATCAAVAVLEVSENRWRFAHDKLRETLLAEASEDERKSWHRRIGETMESVYAADLDPHAAALGYHFDQAGQSGPALRYKLLAGKRAMQSGAVQEAIVHLDRAVDLLARTNAGPAARVNALGLLSQAYNSAGRTKEAGQTLAAMLVDAGFQRDRSALGRLSSIARLALQHAAFQLHAPRSTTVTKPLDRGTAEHPAGGAADELVDNCSTALVAAGEAIALTLSPAQILEVALFWTTLTERALNPANMALAYNSLGVMLSMTPIGWLADGYFRRSGELLAQAPDPPPGLRVHLAAREAVMHINHGQWATASKSMADQIGYQARVGNWSQELCALAMQTRIELSCAKTDELLVSLARMELLAHRVNSALYLCFSLCCHGLLALRAGETDRARRLLRQASEHERRARDGSVSVFWGGCSALAALRDGDPVEARQVADATLESLLAASSIALATGIAALAETYLVLWSQAPAKAGKVELHRRLRQSLAALRMSGVMIPADRPIGFLWHGQYAAQLGHPKLAAWLLRKAIEAAVGYRMPFEEGLARQALAAVNRKSNRIPL